MRTSLLRRLIACIALSATLGALDSAGATDDGGLAKMIETVRSRFKDVKQLSTGDLAAWLADKTRPQPQLLDVREPAEFAVSHLPGAIHVSPDAKIDNVLAKLDRARPVVTYCSVGYRSSKMAQRLKAAGLKDVMNLEGSIFAWANEGRVLEKDGKPVSTVHPYNSTYGRMLKPERRSQ